MSDTPATDKVAAYWSNHGAPVGTAAFRELRDLSRSLERDLSALRKENEVLTRLLALYVDPEWVIERDDKGRFVIDVTDGWYVCTEEEERLIRSALAARALLAKEGEERHE